ncbi:cell division protein FtsQ/DivIB [Thermocrinis sp.]|jgi:cell division protein FtsQ|uniref:cell division protein FtsQ/DivIB n=1 Tax=Thermocrinis sp. TaxID=2024383 RepID=UPI003C0EB11C
MKEEKKRGWVATLEVALALVWLIAMALAGFFFPGFLTFLPVFKIKEIQIYGINNIPPSAISLSVYQVSKNNWLFLDSKRLFAKANELTNNSLKDIKIERKLSLDGARVNIYVQERVPIAYVVHDNTLMMIDEQGELFYNPAIENKLPTIYTFSFDYIKKYHTNLNNLVDSIKNTGFSINEVYVTDRNTIIYISGGRVVLPPLSQISPLFFDRIKRIYNKIGTGKVDILITSENMAVIREGK